MGDCSVPSLKLENPVLRVYPSQLFILSMCSVYTSQEMDGLAIHINSRFLSGGYFVECGFLSQELVWSYSLLLARCPEVLRETLHGVAKE